MKLTFERFDKSIDDKLVSQLSSGWDWPLSDAASLEDYMVYAYSKPTVCYWMFDEVFGIKFPVGLLELSLYSESGFPIREFDYEVSGAVVGESLIPSFIDIGLFLGKDLRGEGRAEVLLHSTAEAMNRLGLPFAATVHEDNGRSYGFMIKATGHTGKFIREHVRNRKAHFYDFSKFDFVPSRVTESVVEVLIADGDEIASILNK